VQKPWVAKGSNMVTGGLGKKLIPRKTKEEKYR